MKYNVLITDEFAEWIEEKTAKSRVQIAKRLENIKKLGHFGDHKRVRERI